MHQVRILIILTEHAVSGSCWSSNCVTVRERLNVLQTTAMRWTCDGLSLLSSQASIAAEELVSFVSMCSLVVRMQGVRMECFLDTCLRQCTEAILLHVITDIDFFDGRSKFHIVLQYHVYSV